MTQHADPPRRSFLTKMAAVVVGGIVSVVPAVLGGGFFLTPLLRKKSEKEAGDGFIKLGKTESLVAGGEPQIFKVNGIKHDAWTTYAEAALGAVYLRMLENGDVTAFNAKCPHLGCAVGYKSDENAYVCPCHDSAFSLEGDRTNEIPPRNMDTLEVEIRNDDEIWVRFVNYRSGTADKIPV